MLNRDVFEDYIYNKDPFLEPIQRKIEGKTKKFSTREILIETELREAKNITSADMNNAARILKSLGCVRDKNQTRNSISGVRSRLWSLPHTDSPD